MEGEYRSIEVRRESKLKEKQRRKTQRSESKDNETQYWNRKCEEEKQQDERK